MFGVSWWIMSLAFHLVFVSPVDFWRSLIFMKYRRIIGDHRRYEERDYCLEDGGEVHF